MRIKKVEIRDYKAFFGLNEFNVEDKNLFIYGENGSGKSSFYYALKDFFQSSAETLNYDDTENIFLTKAKNHFNTLTIFVFVILSVLTFKGYGQTSIDINRPDKEMFKNIDSLGQNSDPNLNAFESDYFNQIFLRKRDTFDFTNKTIAFVTGSNGRTPSNKKRYFDLERDRIAREYSLNGGILTIFNETEKEQSGGYDAVILYWSKILPTKKNLIKVLKRPAKTDLLPN